MRFHIFLHKKILPYWRSLQFSSESRVTKYWPIFKSFVSTFRLKPKIHIIIGDQSRPCLKNWTPCRYKYICTSHIRPSAVLRGRIWRTFFFCQLYSHSHVRTATVTLLLPDIFLAFRLFIFQGVNSPFSRKHFKKKK